MREQKYHLDYFKQKREILAHLTKKAKESPLFMCQPVELWLYGGHNVYLWSPQPHATKIVSPRLQGGKKQRKLKRGCGQRRTIQSLQVMSIVLKRF